MDAGRHHGVILIKRRQLSTLGKLMATHINTQIGGLIHLVKPVVSGQFHVKNSRPSRRRK